MIRIMLGFTAAAVAFGIVHDQATAHVCVEYFTVAHQRIVSSKSPVVLGLLWGVVATWWAGALAGIVVSLAAREGPWPKWGWRAFVRPAAYLAPAMVAGALVAGLAGYGFVSRQVIGIVPCYADAIAPERQARFLADVFAHAATYGIGFLGAGVVAAWALNARRRTAS